VPVDQAHEPDVNAGGQAAWIVATHIGQHSNWNCHPSCQRERYQTYLTSYQNDSARVPATTLEPKRINARNERTNNNGYNIRLPTTRVPPVEVAMKSGQQVRTATHLVASIASGDPFTKRAVGEIKLPMNMNVLRKHLSKYDFYNRLLYALTTYVCCSKTKNEW
jgi:hypothetical protein